ncbi:hypothetical protein [Amycolatopsis regifaucium]|uniref:Secreted protein n=1 Tax=Amycolatopsis regifaucium TaxID=546365 RepID=A0A154M4I5_9PSEU|nr:hypothetical protein [Amycolatopsis regifaucium]KZB79476.1 hypothetical protein AVL48_18035 [Amycolatopsis regifaucium]OKA07658.1 hypothetical protein ATP06_0217720 [Amycolatopsis regifaucium]SFH06151.1 hypothetical protein SAMN04489731_102269 [Amycolatopsis regifaucium]
MSKRFVFRGAVLAATVAGSVLTAGSAMASTAEPCAAGASGDVAAASCTPYRKQSEGWSSKTACNRAGNEGAQAMRWTGWNCNQALAGWELWVRTCTTLAAEKASATTRETV